MAATTGTGAIATESPPGRSIEKGPLTRHASMIDVLRLRRRVVSSSQASTRSASVASVQPMVPHSVVSKLLQYRTAATGLSGMRGQNSSQASRINYWKKLREEDNSKRLAKVSEARVCGHRWKPCVDNRTHWWQTLGAAWTDTCALLCALQVTCNCYASVIHVWIQVS